MAINKFNPNRDLYNTRYAVKRSEQKYSTIISTHRTLGEAYKTLVRWHRQLHKHHRFPMAQDVIAIIATVATDQVIIDDIRNWRYLEGHSIKRSRQRLPLPIVVHQWQPNYSIYIRFGESHI